MKVQDVVRALEAYAPVALAAEWDNVGLLLGDARSSVARILFCIDLTEPVLDEALACKAQMVMAYHPPIFKPVSRLTAAQTPVLYRAARAGLAVYSVHTALDAAPGGTNDVLAGVLGMTGARPLEPLTRQGQCKIVVFVPPDDLSRVAEAAFSAGAGRIGNYHDCAFFVHGIGAFCGGRGTHPTHGRAGRHEVGEEMRLEIIAPRTSAAAVVAAIRAAHSYEEPAVDVYPLDEFPEGCGMGRVGALERPASVDALVARVKKAVGLSKIMVARASRAGKAAGKAGGKIVTAACGAGSCGNLYKHALAAGAGFYLTGEMRHHDALACAAAGMTVACVGHSNSERLALGALADRVKHILPKLSALVSRRDKDPFEVV